MAYRLSVLVIPVPVSMSRAAVESPQNPDSGFTGLGRGGGSFFLAQLRKTGQTHVMRYYAAKKNDTLEELLTRIKCA